MIDAETLTAAAGSVLVVEPMFVPLIEQDTVVPSSTICPWYQVFATAATVDPPVPLLQTLVLHVRQVKLPLSGEALEYSMNAPSGGSAATEFIKPSRAA
jgi:hypothetical protein